MSLLTLLTFYAASQAYIGLEIQEIEATLLPSDKSVPCILCCARHYLPGA